ncbi:kinesin-like protein KIN-7I [Drosophila subpulchrella]|uniref:kinesin-like protein KIN-7I n=1 Tax=Drosophila subpulchrella TaxID=1486046 RepID=UPI0018A13809|nr:kinesin-like protein KIN-7I [Drosophila subpulchrella]
MSAKIPSSLQVCVKVRPCEAELTSHWQVNEGRSIHLADGHAEPYVFDYVFDEGTSNQEVFDRMAKHIVHACMQGFNGTIFAYGQTSSGKTYTMMGDGQMPGVMALAAKEIFQQISSDTERDFLLRVRFIEIYNEKIYDLLNKKNQDLKIHEASNGVVNVNCEECIITSEDDLLRHLCNGNKERTVGETNMNERSSRSHAIFRIIIESRKSDQSDDDAVVQSVLNMVDLAGSDRVDHTGSQDHINSNIILGNVIKSLSEHVDNKFISFRDSKLTRVLQASLCGNALTSVICTIKPWIIEESQSTLCLATRASKIRIKPQVNEVDSDTTMLIRVDRGIKNLKNKLAEEERKKESQLVVQDLERRIKRDMLKIISSTSLSDQRLQKRRRNRAFSNSGSESEIAVTSLPVLPEESRLPRPLKMSSLPKPMFFPNSGLSHRREIAPKTIGVYQSLKDEFIPGDMENRIGQPKLLEAEAARSNPSEINQIPKQDQESMANCHALQVEVSALTASNQVAKETIENYEEQVKTLKKTIERLEMENREAVNLGLRFESHKTKSKEKETELLTALSEKDSTIEGLQQSLKELSRDVLRNSKEDHMRSMCPDLESSCERICNKCHELERLLPIADVNGLETIACQCDQLRSEIAATRIKLESVQSAFSQASCEVSQKTTDCERLSRQISTAQDDFGQLQGKYNSLEQQWLGQQLAIETMQADYYAIQQKYQKLQEEYEHLEKRSDEQCQQLQAENTKLQEEIGTLKGRVEEAQRKLLEVPNPEYLAEEFKAQNQELKAQLSDLQSKFNGIQIEYDCLSSELMESVLEGEALREEIKQRQSSYDLESMKSSGVGTECSEPDNNPDTDSDLMEQFVKLSESIQQIELQHHSGFTCLFIVNRLEQDESVPRFKLCLESAEDLEGDTSQQDTSDSVCLKGFLKRQRFRIVRMSQEEVCMREEDRLRNIISQLELEVENQKALIKDEEAIIHEMREQVTTLKSDLLEKNVLLNKVEDYQRQIDALQKQNAEMTNSYKQLQDEVTKQSPMNESLLEIPADEDTIPKCRASSIEEDQESKEVATLKAVLAELKTKVCDLQAELESQLKQMQLKDKNIAKLHSHVEEMGERCLSMGQRLTELEEDSRQKQELLDRQGQKLFDDVCLIDQLQEKNAKLEDRSVKAEESLQLEKNKQEQTIDSSEYKQQIEVLEESLKKAQEELRILEKSKTNEINGLKLEYMTKIESSEIENRAKFRSYSLEMEESKDRYESSVALLKEQLMKAGEELSSVTARFQAELKGIKCKLQEKISQAEEERNILNAEHQAELENIREILKETLAGAEAKQAKIKDAYKAEISDVRATLKEQLSQAEEEREKAEARLQEMKKSLEELEVHNSAMRSTIAEMKKRKSEQDLALEEVRIEKRQLEELYDQEMQLRSRDQNGLGAQTNDKINELQEKCGQQALDLDKLRQEKLTLQSEIQDANAQHTSTFRKLQELEAEMNVLSKQKELEKSDLENKVETFNAKITDLEEALHCAKIKILTHEGLISQHERLTICLSEANELSGTLREKVERLHSELLSSQKDISSRDAEIKQLRSDLFDAMDAKTIAGMERVELSMQLKEVEEKISIQEGSFKSEVKDLKGSIIELELKLTSLQEIKNKLETGNEELKVKLKNADDLQDRLEKEQKLCASLKEDFAKLEEVKTDLAEQIRAKEAEVDHKTKELKLEVDVAQNKVEELTRECENLRSDLQSKERAFWMEKELLDGTISNLQKDKRIVEDKFCMLNEELTKECEKLRTTLKSNESDLLKSKQELAEKLSILEKKDNDHARLMAQFASKEAVFASLQEDSTKQKQSLEMVERLAKECETLRSTVKSRETNFRAEKERMDGTISILMEDKRNLEEKLCTVTEIMTKLELELAAFQAANVNGGNVSLKPSSSNMSPTSASASSAKKTVDRIGVASVSRKSISFEVRKNRRITAYDEHRKQSCWNDFRDCGTMTDSVDSNCHCSELSLEHRLNPGWKPS